MKTRWQLALPSESAFWEHWLATRGGDWPQEFAHRLDPSWPLQPWLVARLARNGRTHHHILDVGAGPLTATGKVWSGHEVRITAVDPLAETYDALLARHGITPLVRTSWCHGEQLSQRFAPETFDLVWAWNCLDHSYDPIVCIEEALTVVRTGGCVYLLHNRNEAETERYRGLHQWNFVEQGGHAYLWGRHGAVDLTRHFRAVAGVEAWSEGREVHIILEKRWPGAVGARKRAVLARINRALHEMAPLWRLHRLRFR